MWLAYIHGRVCLAVTIDSGGMCEHVDAGLDMDASKRHDGERD